VPDLVRSVRAALDDTSGRPVLVGVDGRSGAGKTALAARLAAALEDAGAVAAVVHLEDLYPGWTGLRAGLAVLCRDVVAPLRAGRAAAYPSWDWLAGAPGPVLTAPAAQVVVLEGVGVLSAACAHRLDVRVWLEAPDHVRRARALARDGATFAPWWDTWAAQEDAVLACGRPPADLVVDTGADDGAHDTLGA
jgi:uridine kinase